MADNRPACLLYGLKRRRGTGRGEVEGGGGKGRGRVGEGDGKGEVEWGRGTGRGEVERGKEGKRIGEKEMQK
jgi:hypothetical protein